jgi:hypothetical protein
LTTEINKYCYDLLKELSEFDEKMIPGLDGLSILSQSILTAFSRLNIEKDYSIITYYNIYLTKYH